MIFLLDTFNLYTLFDLGDSHITHGDVKRSGSISRNKSKKILFYNLSFLYM